MACENAQRCFPIQNVRQNTHSPCIHFRNLLHRAAQKDLLVILSNGVGIQPKWEIKAFFLISKMLKLFQRTWLLPLSYFQKSISSSNAIISFSLYCSFLPPAHLCNKLHIVCAYPPIWHIFLVPTLLQLKLLLLHILYSIFLPCT